jgi:cytidylate kinase
MSENTAPGGAPTRPVVTLFETYGSGASYVGPRVAQGLGLPFHAQAFSSEEIERAMVERESEGVLSRVFGGMGGTYAALDGPAVAMAQQDNYELIMENTRIVEQEARQGGVVMGRNGALILAGRPGTLHVKLDGPLEQRIERAAADSGISVERSAKRQKREDQARADMSLVFYGWDPRDDDRYDLVVNTGTMDLDTCVEIIVAAALVKAGLRDAGARGRSRPAAGADERLTSG